MITEQERRDNLNKLADYLLSLPDDYKDFDMSQFHIYPINSELYKPNICGTSACAVGHGPNAGIGDYRTCANWIEYSQKYLIYDINSADWYWCFSGGWADVDDTPHGAAKRIKQYLRSGVPDDFGYQYQDGWGDDYYYSTDLYEEV